MRDMPVSLSVLHDRAAADRRRLPFERHTSFICTECDLGAKGSNLVVAHARHSTELVDNPNASERPHWVPAGLTNAEVADVYRQYGFLLRRRCRIILKDDALADDALQEVFVRVMRFGKQLQHTDRPLGWLYRVADRCCFDQLRKRKRRAEVHEPSPEHAGAHPAARLEVRDAVLSFLQTLNDVDRRMTVLAFVDGMSQGEIATELDCSRQTINKRLNRVRDRAEKVLGRALG